MFKGIFDLDNTTDLDNLSYLNYIKTYYIKYGNFIHFYSQKEFKNDKILSEYFYSIEVIKNRYLKINKILNNGNK